MPNRPRALDSGLVAHAVYDTVPSNNRHDHLAAAPGTHRLREQNWRNVWNAAGAAGPGKVKERLVGARWPHAVGHRVQVDNQSLPGSAFFPQQAG